MTVLLELAERAVARLIFGHARECYSSLTARPDLWTFGETRMNRVSPYPMSFYTDDRRLYYAIDWGCSVPLWPHERWLLNRAVAKARASILQANPDA